MVGQVWQEFAFAWDEELGRGWAEIFFVCRLWRRRLFFLSPAGGSALLEGKKTAGMPLRVSGQAAVRGKKSKAPAGGQRYKGRRQRRRPEASGTKAARQRRRRDAGGTREKVKGAGRRPAVRGQHVKGAGETPAVRGKKSKVLAGGQRYKGSTSKVPARRRRYARVKSHCVCVGKRTRSRSSRASAPSLVASWGAG
jgi:hypothetical protein